MVNNNTQTEEFPPLTKELAQKFMAMKGECRGVALKSDWEVILHTRGKEDLAKLEAKMAELGYPLKYEEIKETDFYPIGYDAVSMLAIRDVFNFTNKDFEELGTMAFKFSVLIKLVLKYFTSIRLVAEQTSEMWGKYYTVGDMEVAELNEKEKYAILRIKNLTVHPFFCTCQTGYFSAIVKMMVNSPVTCKETKCTFRGDEYHEFLIKW